MSLWTVIYPVTPCPYPEWRKKMQIPLSRKQLSQLTEEYQTLEDWTTIRDFCTQVYGKDKVVKVEIETYGEYDDEGGTNYYIQSLTAYNCDDEEIAFDLTLPFWQQFEDVQKKVATLNKDTRENLQDMALDALKDWSPWREEDKAIKQSNGWIDWHELPRDEDNAEYDLLTQPTISFPVVVALQG
jgi:hypothetical protein